jgi:POT family proton-dependent oligopeptide transporter
VFGGLLADKFIGQRAAVIIGGLLMAAGQFLLTSESMFLLGLGFLIVGNGCFKPNLASQVGTLYPPGDPRLDRAYSIYYMGVNLGAFFAPLVCGTLGQLWGWKYGFAAAGVGMILGIIQYSLGGRFLPKDTVHRAKEAKAEKVPLTGQQKKVILALIVLVFLNVIFWAVYEQQGNTLQLWADQNTVWPTIGGFTIPSTWYQSFNPFMIWIFTPFLTMLWAGQAKKNQEPSSLVKMALGCIMLGLGFVVMIAASQGIAPDTKRSLMWLVGSTSIYTLGELYLSPIGLSFVTKVAPARMVSMMMGVWFLANFIGNYMTGYLGTFYETMPKSNFFLLMTLIAVIAGVVLLAISKPLNRIVGRHDAQQAH